MLIYTINSYFTSKKSFGKFYNKFWLYIDQEKGSLFYLHASCILKSDRMAENTYSNLIYQLCN